MSDGPRIAYDARVFTGKPGGRARYLHALLAGREQQIIGFCASGKSNESLRLIAGGFRSHSLWEQVSLPRLLSRHDIATFISPYLTVPWRISSSVRLVLLVHDLNVLLPPARMQRAGQNSQSAYRRRAALRSLHNADLIVTSSAFVAHQMTARLAVEPSRLRVIPDSIPHKWFERAEPERSPDGFVLIVAGEGPGKDLLRAFEAFALCRKMGHPLLRLKIARLSPKLHRELRQYADRLGINRHIDFLFDLSDDELRTHYRRADVLLMPCLTEEGAISMLEAMASGVPIVSCKAGSLPEVGGAAPLYVDSWFTGDVAAALHQVLSDRDLAAQMSKAGLLQARQFHWDAVRPRIERFWEELTGATAVTPTSELVA